MEVHLTRSAVKLQRYQIQAIFMALFAKRVGCKLTPICVKAPFRFCLYGAIISTILMVDSVYRWSSPGGKH